MLPWAALRIHGPYQTFMTKRIPLPEVKFSPWFEALYGKDILAFAEAVQRMTKDGDEGALREAIEATKWLFPGPARLSASSGRRS